MFFLALAFGHRSFDPSHFKFEHAAVSRVITRLEILVDLSCKYYVPEMARFGYRSVHPQCRGLLRLTMAFWHQFLTPIASFTDDLDDEEKL